MNKKQNTSQMATPSSSLIDSWPYSGVLLLCRSAKESRLDGFLLYFFQSLEGLFSFISWFVIVTLKKINTVQALNIKHMSIQKKAIVKERFTVLNV